MLARAKQRAAKLRQRLRDEQALIRLLMIVRGIGCSTIRIIQRSPLIAWGRMRK